MKKSILFIIMVLIVFSLVLFANVNHLNEEEILYKNIAPPDMELSDGFSSIIRSAKIENWYFRGKDNRFHPVFFGEQNKLNQYNEQKKLNIINGPKNEKTAKTGDNFNNDKESNLKNNEVENINMAIQSRRLYYTGTLKLRTTCNPDNVTLQISKDDAPETIIFEDNNLKFEKSSVEGNFWECLLFQPKEEGKFVYRIIATWNKPEIINEKYNDKNYDSNNASSNVNFYGTATYEFSFINDVPVEFHVSSTQTYPGEIITIFVKYANEDENTTLKSDLFQSELPFYSYEQGKFAILPISYTISPADYTISLQVERTNSEINQNDVTTTSAKRSYVATIPITTTSTESSSHDITIHVLPKDFPIQYLSISTEIQQATQNDAAYEEYNKYVGAVRKTNTPVKMWDGVFIQPVEGRISTEFGMRRFVNNAPTLYRHSGIDIAADKGVPIKAANSGKVILSRYLTLTGNTVLIDHGYGIISWYYHMDTLSVNGGDMIEKGQIIGTVGSTGFSTGPHLHFSISVHDVFTNPWTFFKQEPVIFE